MPSVKGGIPDNVMNAKLYKEAQKQADETYKRHSAYKSMYLVRKYKELGGTYKDEKNKGKTKTEREQGKQKLGTKRTGDWLDEEWIQIKPYLKKKPEKVVCGDNDDPKACRPLKKVENQITMGEIIKKYGKKKVGELTDQKMKDMDGRLDWRYGTFTPSKKNKVKGGAFVSGGILIPKGLPTPNPKDKEEAEKIVTTIEAIKNKMCEEAAQIEMKMAIITAKYKLTKDGGDGIELKPDQSRIPFNQYASKNEKDIAAGKDKKYGIKMGDIEKKFLNFPLREQIKLDATGYKVQIFNRIKPEGKGKGTKELAIYVDIFEKLSLGYAFLSRLADTQKNNELAAEVLDAYGLIDKPFNSIFRIQPNEIAKVITSFLKLRETDVSGVQGSQTVGNDVTDFFLEKFRHLTKNKNGISFKDAWTKPYLKIKYLPDVYSMKKRDLVNKGLLFKDCEASVYKHLTGAQIRSGFESSIFSNNQFKPYVAKWLYKQEIFNIEKAIYDPFFGWGGRCVGAMSIDMDYYASDTNSQMRESIEMMWEHLRPYFRSTNTVFWQDSAITDLSTIEYDFVFSSPPYLDEKKKQFKTGDISELEYAAPQIEDYDGMPPYPRARDFYEKLILPVMANCFKHLPDDKWLCLNVPQHNNKTLEQYYNLPKEDHKIGLVTKARGGTNDGEDDDGEDDDGEEEEEEEVELDKKGKPIKKKKKKKYKEFIYCWQKKGKTKEIFMKEIVANYVPSNSPNAPENTIKSSMGNTAFNTGKTKTITRKQKTKKGGGATKDGTTDGLEPVVYNTEYDPIVRNPPSKPKLKIQPIVSRPSNVSGSNMTPPLTPITPTAPSRPVLKLPSFNPRTHKPIPRISSYNITPSPDLKGATKVTINDIFKKHSTDDNDANYKHLIDLNDNHKKHRQTLIEGKGFYTTQYNDTKGELPDFYIDDGEDNRYSFYNH